MVISWTLKPLDAATTVQFDVFLQTVHCTHHCELYEKCGWSPKASRRQKCVFTSTALSELPRYSTSLISELIYMTPNHRGRLALKVPHVISELKKTGFWFYAHYAPHYWNDFHHSLKVETLLITLRDFKLLRSNILNICNCCI